MYPRRLEAIRCDYESLRNRDVPILQRMPRMLRALVAHSCHNGRFDLALRDGRRRLEGIRTRRTSGPDRRPREVGRDRLQPPTLRAVCTSAGFWRKLKLRGPRCDTLRWSRSPW